MAERLNYHEVTTWDTEQIHIRLGALALNKEQMNSRQQKAAESEIDYLIFELSCREDVEDGRTAVPATAQGA